MGWRVRGRPEVLARSERAARDRPPGLIFFIVRMAAPSVAVVLVGLETDPAGTCSTTGARGVQPDESSGEKRLASITRNITAGTVVPIPVLRFFARFPLRAWSPRIAGYIKTAPSINPREGGPAVSPLWEPLDATRSPQARSSPRADGRFSDTR